MPGEHRLRTGLLVHLKNKAVSRWCSRTRDRACLRRAHKRREDWGWESSLVTYLTWVWTYNLYHEQTEA